MDREQVEALEYKPTGSIIDDGNHDWDTVFEAVQRGIDLLRAPADKRTDSHGIEWGLGATGASTAERKLRLRLA